MLQLDKLVACIRGDLRRGRRARRRGAMWGAHVWPPPPWRRLGRSVAQRFPWKAVVRSLELPRASHGMIRECSIVVLVFGDDSRDSLWFRAVPQGTFEITTIVIGCGRVGSKQVNTVSSEMTVVAVGLLSEAGGRRAELSIEGSRQRRHAEHRHSQLASITNPKVLG